MNESKEVETLRQLQEEVASMRKSQKDYFLTKSQVAFNRSRSQERKVDAILARYQKEFSGNQALYTCTEFVKGILPPGFKVFIDGSQCCILLGENIMEGLAGFGSSPFQAMQAFLTELRDNQDKIKKMQMALEKERQIKFEMDLQNGKETAR